MNWEKVWANVPVFVADADRKQAQVAVQLRDGEFLVIRPDLAVQPNGLQSVVSSISTGTKPIEFSAVRLDAPGAVAAVFTKSLCASDAVVHNRVISNSGTARVVAVISKNANVFTPTSREDLEAIVGGIAAEFAVNRNEVLLSCTGVIGVALPTQQILNGIRGLSEKLSRNSLESVSHAILTTDRRPKVASVCDGEVVIAGMIKGAGMIEPNLATMLGFIYTNAAISSQELSAMLHRATETTFNCMSVDTDTSTSDTVAVLSTGTAAVHDLAQFENLLLAICLKLAKDVAAEAEGATKLIEVTVASNISYSDSHQIAKRIVNSPLVKTAVLGGDPNWGRVVMAIGKPADGAVRTAPIDPAQVSISMMGQTLFAKGRKIELNLEKLSKSMKDLDRVAIEVQIDDPVYVAKVWGCDLTEEYVVENSQYTT